MGSGGLVALLSWQLTPIGSLRLLLIFSVEPPLSQRYLTCLSVAADQSGTICAMAPAVLVPILLDRDPCPGIAPNVGWPVHPMMSPVEIPLFKPQTGRMIGVPLNKRGTVSAMVRQRKNT
jgi:hypothetical protein